MAKIKFVSLYNPGPQEIQGFPVGGEKITLLARQQKDYKSMLAWRINDLFSYLEVKGEFTIDDESGDTEQIIGDRAEEDVIVDHGPVEAVDEVKPEPVVEPEPELVVEQPEDNGLGSDSCLECKSSGSKCQTCKDANTSICNMCEKEFKTHRGRKIHMKLVHKS